MRQVERLLGPASIYVSGQFDAQEPTAWDRSCLNPKNRINSLADFAPDWHFFREDMFSSKFSIVPSFAIGRPPLRIGICFSDDFDLDSETWRPLQLDLVTMVQGKGRRKSPLSQHIMNGLAHWSSTLKDFEAHYMALPFGSQIMIQNVTADPRETVAAFVEQHNLELHWKSPQALQREWNILPSRMPSTVDLLQLQLHDELHETIALVTYPQKHGTRMLVFKSSVRNVRYLYHELKLLLPMDPHPNVIGAPLYLVTKRVNFGGKRGVCGMLMEYHAAGNMAQFLASPDELTVSVSLETRFRWAVQLASALVHVTESPAAYYSDLKLDNIVLGSRNGQLDVLLIDFEQRGSWFSWSPPEVNAVAHLIYLARRRGKHGPPPEANAKYDYFLERYLPAWTQRPRRANPQDSGEGFNVAWLSLSPEEKEKALVFMLGKVLWCIFELQPTINAALFLGADIFREVNPSKRFPTFDKTPDQVRGLIRACTLGAPEWADNVPCVQRAGSLIFSKRSARENSADPASDACSAVRQAWADHLQAAKAHVKRRYRGEEDLITTSASNRPSLKEVNALLRQLCQVAV